MRCRWRHRLLIMVQLLIAVTGVLLALGVTAASTEVQSSALSPARFSAISSGVVLVETFDCDGNAIALGSGFLVGTSVVMTARHVVANSCGIKVRGAGRVITASLAGERRELSDGALLAAFAAFPLLTLKVVAGIHWEALKLWWKGVPVYDRPTV